MRLAPGMTTAISIPASPANTLSRTAQHSDAVGSGGSSLSAGKGPGCCRFRRLSYEPQHRFEGSRSQHLQFPLRFRWHGSRGSGRTDPGQKTVWFVISPVDLPLWIKGGSKFDVSVAKVDAPPLQLQGPWAIEVLERLTDRDVRGMRARVAGFDVVISTTGFSGERWFEIYALGATPVVFNRALEATCSTFNHGQGGPHQPSGWPSVH